MAGAAALQRVLAAFDDIEPAQNAWLQAFMTTGDFQSVPFPNAIQLQNADVYSPYAFDVTLSSLHALCLQQQTSRAFTGLTFTSIYKLNNTNRIGVGITPATYAQHVA